MREFARDDPGRSVAVRTLRGEALALDVRGAEPRPGASLLKLPLAAAVWEAGLAGELDLDAAVDVAALPRTVHPTVLAALDAGRELTLREACALCLATSDNPLASHLLELVGADAVNALARRWGCRPTRLTVGFGDAELGDSGRRNVTCAHDALVLVAEICSRPRLDRLRVALANGQRNFRIPLRLPDGLPVAHKTGTLEGVCNDAGVVFGERCDLALAFLCDGQRDTAACSLEIGDCAAAIWAALEAG